MWIENKIGWLRVARSVTPLTFHSLRKKYRESEEAVQYLTKLGKKLMSREDADHEICRTEDYGARIIWDQDAEYPALLKQINDAPPFLVVKGKLLPDSQCISIVGSRNSSLNSNRIAHTLAERLSECGFVIVSGLARGIDRHVHLGSSKNTIGVIAGGINHVYPKDNADLYAQIPSSGAIITEFPIDTPPTPNLFPTRNRIIAGMSIATVVVQAANHSGSLITAQCAIDYNRDVFAVPGCPLDPRSYGTNHLIKNGAALVQDHQDILSQLNTNRLCIQQNIFKSMEEPAAFEDEFEAQTVQQQIFNCLSSEPVRIDDLCNELTIPASTIRQTLVEMELNGQVRLSIGDKVAKQH